MEISIIDFLKIGLSFVILVILSPLLGNYFQIVYSSKTHIIKKPFHFIENIASHFIGPAYQKEMNWKEYTQSVLSISFIGMIITFCILYFQNYLPLNPQNNSGISWDLAINTAISFVTNTNWQAYSGEVAMSYFSQMIALGVQNFLSAATGMAVAVALARGLVNHSNQSIGNFWKDFTQGIIYILLPFSLLLSILLISQGVVQSFLPAQEVTTLENSKQLIPLGPAASQIAIKQLGTNGGGYFGVNSAHPLENPTPLSNWLQLISILLIPGGFVFFFGNMIARKKHSYVLFGTMLILLYSGIYISLWSETQINPNFGGAPFLEGKETRFGITESILWSSFTTAASNGSVNAMHSSMSPITGGIELFNMLLGEIIFGGVGSGIYGMILFVILTVFIAGLMVGRTPEYLGKKIEVREISWTVIGILIPSIVVLVGAGISSILPIATSSLTNKGPHGLSEILYAFASTANNNGSAFAGLSVNTVYYNITLGIAMLLGRFGVIIPVLAIAGSMAGKKVIPKNIGTFDTENSTFLILLIGVILIVGGLTFLPALSLGPIIEHFLMISQKSF